MGWKLAQQDTLPLSLGVRPGWVGNAGAGMMGEAGSAYTIAGNLWVGTVEPVEPGSFLTLAVFHKSELLS